jgi:hypothetical protein
MSGIFEGLKQQALADSVSSKEINFSRQNRKF